MTCHLHRCTNLPEPGYIERGTCPKKPTRWRVNYLIKTPDGKTHIENTVVTQPLTIPELVVVMDAMIAKLGDEVGNVATQVTWDAFSRGGHKKKGKRR
jgi:hypothetical protein